MKITVDLSESQLRDICRLTGNRKKGPAIRQFVDENLRLKKREQLAAKFISGEWGVNLDGLEEARELDRARDERIDRAWRE